MRKTSEDFNFKKHATYDVEAIKNHISNFSSEWLLDTSRQDNYDVHKDTVSYFVYRANLLWKGGDSFFVKKESNDKKLIDLLEPIIKNLEEIHNGTRGMVLLIKLKAGQDISIHFDSGDYLMFSRRNHIPIVTSDNVFFGVGNEKISMQAGECWEINNSRPHLVENNSDIDRVHLLIDIMPNEELETR
jgi:quercetin dioxygenase-like cupin family protein